MSVNKLISQAEAQCIRSNYEAAFNLYKDALSIIDSSSDKTELLNCLKSIADTGRMTGRFKDSLTYYQRAVTIAGEAGDLEFSTDAQVGLGLAYRAIGNWGKALKEFMIAEDFYRKNYDSAGLAFCIWATAGALRIKGDISGTIKVFQNALDMFIELDDQSGAAYCICGLGGANRAIGQYQASLQYYKKANTEFSLLSDRFGVAYSYCGIGNAYRMQGQYDTSMEYLKKAMTVYERIGDIVSSAYTLWSIGMIYLLNNKYKLSERYFNNASDYFKKTGDVRGDVYIGLGMSQIEFMKCNLKLAKELQLQAEKTAGDYLFSLEYCHALRIAEILEEKDMSNCYIRLGVRELNDKFPLNIP
jgi:tetratricopeptide (TPR) repeat protein